MSSWPHRKRGVCHLDSSHFRSKGEINGSKGQSKLGFTVMMDRSKWNCVIYVGFEPLEPLGQQEQKIVEH
jgi:hypothetical protein